MNDQLAQTAQTMLKNIPYGDMRELMIKNRFTCDSHWMMPMVMNAGWKVANKVNQDVSTSVGHVEMRRLMKALNLNKPSNEEDFMILLSLAMEAFLPKGYFDYILTKSNSGRKVASDLGFDVDYVTQATLTFPLSHPFTSETMTVQQIQTRTEMVLHKRFARIATVQEVLKSIQED